MLVQQLVAEFIGSFVFFGCILHSLKTPVGWLGVGLSLAVVVFLFGNLSGANLNPAVSFMMLLHGKLNLMTFVLYICVQLLAAFVVWGFLTKYAPETLA